MISWVMGAIIYTYINSAARWDNGIENGKSTQIPLP